MLVHTEGLVVGLALVRECVELEGRLFRATIALHVRMIVLRLTVAGSKHVLLNLLGFGVLVESVRDVFAS